MILELTTNIVKCDGCDNRIGDVVEQTEFQARMSAIRLGWAEINDDGEAEHYCPECVAAQYGLPMAVAVDDDPERFF